MSQLGIDFANQWVAENIQPSVYAPEDGLHPETESALERFLADAESDGISRQEIEEDIGDLAEFISSALVEATDAELDRLEDDD
jgi:hypothetical protein